MKNSKIPAFLQKERIGSTLQIAALIYGGGGVVLTCISTLISVISMFSHYAASSLPGVIFSVLFNLIKIAIAALCIYAFGVLVEHICVPIKAEGAAPPDQAQEREFFSL